MWNCVKLGLEMQLKHARLCVYQHTTGRETTAKAPRPYQSLAIPNHAESSFAVLYFNTGEICSSSAFSEQK